MSLPDRRASNSLSPRGAFVFAPALQRLAKAVKIVSAFVHACITAGVAVYDSNADPFKAAAQVLAANRLPNGRRLYMDQRSRHMQYIYATSVKGASNNYSFHTRKKYIKFWSNIEKIINNFILVVEFKNTKII